MLNFKIADVFTITVHYGKLQLLQSTSNCEVPNKTQEYYTANNRVSRNIFRVRAGGLQLERPLSWLQLLQYFSVCGFWI